MKTPTICMLSALMAMNVSAATSFGAYDCGQWFTKNQAAKIWFLGYLSGLAAADTTAKVDVLDRLNSAEQAFLWMDNYCQNNPLKKANDGAIDLYIELEKRR